jgi:predicted nuclease of predicted toxin-antitoxin system
VRLVADEKIEPSLVLRLRAEGHTVSAIAEFASGVVDLEVLQIARESEALILTKDKDFGELVYRHRF